MSVCNVLFTADAVHLLTDTMTYHVDGTPHGLTTRKAEVGAGGAFIWAARGSVFLGDRLDKILMDGIRSLAEAEAFTCTYLDTLPSDVCEIVGLRPGKALLEVTLAGWDASTGDLAVRRIMKSAGEEPATTTAYERGAYVSPGPKGGWRGPATVTEAQFVQMALAQHAMQGRLQGIGGPGMCIGGLMHITSLTRNGADQRIVGVYPDYAEHAESLGDPNAEAVAEFLARQQVAA